jgi:hypothetical protein
LFSDGLVIGTGLALIDIADFVDRTTSYPLGGTSAAEFVQHFAEEQAGRGAAQFVWRRRRSIQPQPAHPALVGVTQSARASQVAMLGVATDVAPAITETGKVFHCVTVTLIEPLQ